MVRLASNRGGSRRQLRKGTLRRLIMLCATVGAVMAHAADPADGRYALLEQLHGHTCAGSLMGARLAIAAREAIGAETGLTATYHDLSCPVDGVQVFAGTTLGNRVLKVEDRDEHLLVLMHRASGRSVRARLTPLAKERGAAYRAAATELRSLPAAAPERAAAQQRRDAILEWFRTAPQQEVVAVTTE